MYRIDVYVKTKTGKKKHTSCWYPSEQEAIDARKALMSIPKGLYCNQWRENGPTTKKILGGWICSNPIKDDRN